MSWRANENEKFLFANSIPGTKSLRKKRNPRDFSLAAGSEKAEEGGIREVTNTENNFKNDTQMGSTSTRP